MSSKVNTAARFQTRMPLGAQSSTRLHLQKTDLDRKKATLSIIHQSLLHTTRWIHHLCDLLCISSQELYIKLVTQCKTEYQESLGAANCLDINATVIRDGMTDNNKQWGKHKYPVPKCKQVDD